MKRRAKIGVEDEIREHYAVEDGQQATHCIKQKIRETKGSCVPRIVLLTRAGCGGCQEPKAAYKEDIASGLVVSTDMASEEGTKIARQNGITSVRALLILDCNGEAIV